MRPSEAAKILGSLGGHRKGVPLSDDHREAIAAGQARRWAIRRREEDARRVTGLIPEGRV